MDGFLAKTTDDRLLFLISSPIRFWVRKLRAQPGGWPDADMLPLGYLGPAPGWGKPRQTRLSHDEERTLMTLWSIFPSPLMIGGDLTAVDPWTVSLLTNPEVLAVDQHSIGNHPVVVTGKVVVWLAEPAEKNGFYIALFNRSETVADIRYAWTDLGLDGHQYALRDLWERKDLGKASELKLSLPSHGCALYRLTRADNTAQ